MIGEKTGVPNSFASDIHALDCKLRREKDKREKLGIEHDIWLLRNAPNSRNSKRFIGRQMQVRAGTYKKPANWLTRGRHMDAE
jgi:hypothetical protein